MPSLGISLGISRAAISSGPSVTVALADPSPVYDSVSTTLSATTTGSPTSVKFSVKYGEGAYAEVGTDTEAPWSVAFTATQSGAATLKAEALIGAVVVATSELELTVGTYAEGLAAEFATIGESGTSQLLWARTGAEYLTLEGSDVTQWQDLTGNAQHATDGTDRPAFVDPGGGADPYINFVGTNNDHFLIPYAQANSATHYTIAFSFYSPAAGTYNNIIQLYNGIRIQVLNNNLYVWIGATINGYVSAVTKDTNHAVVITWDATVADATQRVRVWADSEERFFVTAPSWPNFPASHTGGRIGNRQTSDQDYTGRVHFLAQWYTETLNDDAVGALFDILREHLAYASAWTPTGTTLAEHTYAAPVISETPVPLTCTGLTVTAGTPVTVYDKGANHAGFTAMAANGDGTYDVYWREGAAHSDATGKICRSTSTATWETWGARTDVVDTANIDDRDPHVGMLSGVETLFWKRYLVGGVSQIYSTPTAGGAIANVFGYPLIAGAQKFTCGFATPLDNGAFIVAYGGPTTTGGWLCIRESTTDVHWYPSATYGGLPVLIFEPSPVHLASGGYLMLTRSGYPGTATGPVIQTRSTDCKAWTDWQFFPSHYGGETDEYRLGIDAPKLFQMSTGTLVCVGRRRYATGVPLTLFYSTTAGASWSIPIGLLELVSTDGGYCDVQEIDSTHVLVSYYRYDGSYVDLICVIPVTIEATP